jgi:8-oxo-dGTP diphosphatase
VWRARDATVEVLLVHRPRFDDWSLPKGKVKAGEHRLAAAVREVLEETGLRARPGPRLPTTRYPVPVHDATVEKVVDFWAMQVLADPGFTPGDEVDERRWVSLTRAPRWLTYDRDRTVVRALAALRPPLLAPVVLIRHAPAGQRWPVADADRPLTPAGVRRAGAMADVLPTFAPTRLSSASPLRCRQTLEPLAQRLGLAVEVDPAFDEDASPRAASRRLAELSGDATTVVCSQGGLIAPTLAALLDGPESAYRTRKGHGWALTFGAHGGVAAADPLP